MIDSQKRARDIYLRLLMVTKPYWLIFFIGLLATALFSCVDAGFTWLVKPIINQGFIERDLAFIQWLPVIIIAVFLLRGIAGFLSTYCISRVSRHVVMDLRRQLGAHLLRLPISYFDQQSSSHLLSTVIYNVEQVAQATSSTLLTALREGSLAIGLLGVMCVISWRLTVVFLFITPFIVWLLRYASARLRRLSGGVQHSVGDVTQVVNMMIQAARSIRLFGGCARAENRLHEVTHTNKQRELKVVVTNSLGSAGVQTLISIPMAGAIYFATQPHWHVSAGSFAAMVAAMISLLRPVRRMTLVNSEIQKGVAGASSVFELLDQPAQTPGGPVTIQRAQGRLVFSSVSMHYPQTQHPALHDISFTLEPGKTLAIVGASGAGKSSLVQLIPRFYEPSAGQITLDGIDLAQYELASLRAQIAMVSQTIELFDASVAENIRYSQPLATDEQVIAVARLANAYEFIMMLPDGFATSIGENGGLLSGGQRQRIAIARALLKDAPIVIFDEATSSLDTESESAIGQAMQTLTADRSTIVIAHRLSTVEQADHIVVMDEGRIIERGTHRQLLSNNGRYAQLADRQFDQGSSQ